MITKTDQAIEECLLAISRDSYLCVSIGNSSTYQSVSAVGKHILVNGAAQETIANRRTDLEKVNTNFVGFVAYRLKDS